MIRVVDDGGIDDDLALMEATARQLYPSPGQSPYGFVLVIADLMRFIARLSLRALRWSRSRIVRRTS